MCQIWEISAATEPSGKREFEQMITTVVIKEKQRSLLEACRRKNNKCGSKKWYN